MFTDISTEEDKISEVQRFKAELIEQTYSANDMLYVSAVYEKVNNLWWILLLSIGLPLFVVAITISTIFIKIHSLHNHHIEHISVSTVDYTIIAFYIFGIYFCNNGSRLIQLIRIMGMTIMTI